MRSLAQALRRAGRGALRRPVVLCLLLVVVSVPAAHARVPAALQVADPAAGWAENAPVEVDALLAGPSARMQMLYERTIFKVDVLELTMVFGSDAARRIHELSADVPYRDDLGADVTAAALEARDVLVRTRFLRELSLEQFLEGVGENLEHAQQAGLISAEEHARIFASMTEEWSVLRDRGIRTGDRVWYRIREDRVRVVFEAAEGHAPVDLTIEGPEHRRAILGGYLAPASDFREPLVRSLFARALP